MSIFIQATKSTTSRHGSKSMALPKRSPTWRAEFQYVFNSKTRENHILGERPQRCRFCDRTQDETSFRDEAHVVPAALGNRRLKSLEECVSCNQEGSQLEDHLIR